MAVILIYSCLSGFHTVYWLDVPIMRLQRNPLPPFVGDSCRNGGGGGGGGKGGGGGEGEIFRTRPERPWGPAASYTVGTVLFPRGKAAVEWLWPPTPI